ncbi:MAG: hypothetical protein FWC39_07765 [Bacteroidetes bacterium]|nr:hypothetical protein [Bacteroidota bacterium]
MKLLLTILKYPLFIIVACLGIWLSYLGINKIILCGTKAIVLEGFLGFVVVVVTWIFMKRVLFKPYKKFIIEPFYFFIATKIDGTFTFFVLLILNSYFCYNTIKSWWSIEFEGFWKVVILLSISSIMIELFRHIFVPTIILLDAKYRAKDDTFYSIIKKLFD